jgi:hypothetical protein
MKTNTRWLPLFSTNFFGVFNFYFLKTLICVVAVKWVSNQHGTDSMIVSLVSGLSVLPFLFFSPLAGRLAKNRQKKNIIVTIRMLEFLLFMIVCTTFYFQNIYGAMVCICILALFSTLSSPSKYGLIRDIGGDEGISFGTGTLEMFTFFGALLAPLLAFLVAGQFNFFLMSGVFLSVSAISWISIKQLKVSESEPMTNDKDTINPLKFFFTSYRWAGTINGLNLIILGLASFWMVGNFIQMNLLIHCPRTLGMSINETNIVFTSAALGIGIGSYVTGVLSRGKVELGFTPLGGIGMIITLCLIYFFRPEHIVAFTSLIFLSSFFCGVYMVPLSSYVQKSIEGRLQSDMIAYANFAHFLLILISAGLFGIITKYFGTYTVFLALIIIMLLMNLTMVKYVPNMFNRFLKVIGISKSNN